ncbi:CRTAC1 family protein [Nanohaloarchaea archaeon]|nr:CRTAC1 family protein [Candidatus Nanohaloarchaea archaeon]
MSKTVEVPEGYVIVAAVLLLFSIAVTGLYLAGSEGTGMVEDLMAQDGSDNSFVDISDKIEDNPSLRRYGLASVKVQGATRIFVTGYGGPNALMKWEEGSLVSDTPENLKYPDTNAIGAAGCDIDGDGQEEIYVLTTGDQYGGRKDTRDRLYDLQNGSWVDLFEDSSVTNRYSGRSVACHYSPQGYSFFVARYAGPMQMITMNDDSLEDIAPRYNMDKTTGGRSIVNVPRNGSVDLFVGNERGQNFYYNRTRDGYEEIAEELGLADVSLPVRGVTVYDRGEDGDLDLVVSNWNSENKIYKRGSEGFTDVASKDFSSRGPARSLMAEDFDNDGDTSIYLNNIASRQKAPNRFFNSRGEEIPIGDASEPQGLGTGATVTDINGDDTLEMVLAHGETGSQPLTMYKIPNDNPSLRIQPLWKSGAPARNALVKVDGKVKSVDGGSGYLNQMEPWAHFGSISAPVNVTVTFPDGREVSRQVEGDAVRISHPEG